MRNILPILTVVFGLFVIWYAGAVYLNSNWAYDKAKRADVELSFGVMVADTMAQKKPRLPPPHQVIAEIWKTTGAMVQRGRAFSKRSLIYHGWITLSSTMLGFVFGTGLGILLAVAIVHSRAMDMSVMPWVIASQTIPILAIAPMIVVVLASAQDDFIAKGVISMYLSFFPVVVGMVKGFAHQIIWRWIRCELGMHRVVRLFGGCAYLHRHHFCLPPSRLALLQV